MAVDTTAARSRRSLLAVAATGAAALAAHALGRPVRATHGGADQDIVKGQENTAFATTTLRLGFVEDGSTQYADTFLARSANGNALHGRASGDTGSGVFGEGSFGVRGEGEWGVQGRGTLSGVRGFGPTGVEGSGEIGVDGLGQYSAGSIGVRGTTVSSGWPSVLGVHRGSPSDGIQPGTGVQGFSGPERIGPTPDHTGVYGYAAQKQTATGVLGHLTIGRGVHGRAGGGIGVLAEAPVRGTALKVDGIARFGRSGRLTIPAGQRAARVIVHGINPDSLALATLQQLRDGVWILAAVPSARDDTITIYLNKPAPANTDVAWQVLN